MNISDENWRDLQTIWDYLRIEDKLPDRADAIIGGGAGSRVDIAERAAQLYHENRAPIIVFSGFQHPDFTENEAELLARKAVELGVPNRAIIREPNARNTGLNIILAAKKLHEHGLTAKNVILVHKPYMTRRFKATAEKQWPTPQPNFYVTSINENFREYMQREKAISLAKRTIASMLGDYQRIDEYAAKGFQTAQPFSQEAENASRRLRKRGFSAKTQDSTLSTENFAK